MVWEWFALFWVLVIILIALWRIIGSRRVLKTSEHRPTIMEIRPLQRTTLGTQAIQQYPVSSAAFRVKTASKEELSNRRLRFVNLVETAKKQDIPDETKRKIIREYEAKIADIDRELKQL